MLYISKVLGRTKVEVTDTDDGVVEVWLTADLEKLWINNIDSFNIRGMEWVSGKRFKYTASTPDFNVKALKQYMLNGLRMDIKDGVLVRFIMEKPLIQDLTIVVSKYCDKIENYSFLRDNLEYRSRKGSVSDVKITIVLDDTVDIAPYAFNELKGGTFLKICFDLTQVSDSKIVKKVYNIWDANSWHSFIFEHWRIVDRHERFLQYAADALLKTTFKPDNLLDTYSRDDVTFMNNHISKKHKKKLLKWIGMISNEEFMYTTAHLERKNIFVFGDTINKAVAEKYYADDALLASINFMSFEDQMCHAILHEFKCEKEIGILKNYVKIFHRDYQIMNAWHDCLYSFFRKYESYMYRFERIGEKNKRVAIKI